ncbi:hypothetical protein RmaAA213_25330 [Rhodothermus marinus]|nr:hypothetical protein RmaAA213_25330 [Rhodothermus marinus]BBM73672.1 hypothetical protein RmaAA338_25370 [Rhodothermus marinus]
MDGVRLTFGTTGNLRHSDLVMWDRQTESWWQQFEGQAIVGRLAGYRLRSLPAMLIDWRTFKQQYPQGRVLSRQTGYRRPCGRNPYPGYERLDRPPLLLHKLEDDRLLPMQKVVGVVYQEQARAYPLALLRRHRVVMDTLGAVPLVVFWQDGTAAALDGRRMAEGRKEGSVGVFLRQINGRILTFEARSEGFYDRETGSRWTITGQAVAGPLRGRRLTPLVHHTVFWFVWAVFQPEGSLYTESQTSDGLD